MRLISYGVAAVAIYCIQHVLLVYFPDPLFPYHRTYEDFTVHMREEIPPEITVVLDRVEILLSVRDSIRHLFITRSTSSTAFA
ncbi:MAG: hypothetical protein IID39_00190 [Planctomycetes bacterium]|nr:hypothetical protein [Planctomycetota bacterium]